MMSVTQTKDQERIAELENELARRSAEYQARANRQEAEITHLYDRLQAAHQERDLAWSLVPTDRQKQQIRETISTRWEELAEGDVLVTVESDFRGSLSVASGQIHRANLQRGARLKALIDDMVDGLVLGVIADQVKVHKLEADA